MKKKTVLFALGFSLVCLQVAANPHKTILPDEGWKFIQKDVEDASLPKYNASDRKIITVPHDRAINKPFDMNIAWQVVRMKADFEKIPQHGTHNTGTSLYYCIGWYKKSIYET